jgi:hypothetical protein
MRRFQILVGFLVVALLGVSVLAMYCVEPAMDVAKAECARRGYADKDLSLRGFRGSGGLFGMTQTIQFNVAGVNPPKKLVIDLRQSTYFLSWRVESVREEAQ